MIKGIAISNLISNSTLSLLHRNPMFTKCSTLDISRSFYISLFPSISAAYNLSGS